VWENKFIMTFRKNVLRQSSGRLNFVQVAKEITGKTKYVSYVSDEFDYS
jgi:hypothetical protein